MTSQSFYIAVCDDEPADREKIAEMTKTVCEQEDIHAEITCFETAQELFDELLDGKPFHLLLLDVVMPAQNGMELARQIRRGNKEIPIVFISSDRDMALQGYEVEAVRYLAKPVSLEKLREAVVICHKECRKQKPLYISENGGIRKIVPGDIFTAIVKGISVEILRSDAPEELPLTDAELCSLVINILDNAIEAAVGSDTEEPYIRLDFHCKEHHFVFTCENSTAYKRNRKKKEPMPKHGYGLKIIRKIMNRWGDSMFSIEQSKTVYKITFVIPICD